MVTLETQITLLRHLPEITAKIAKDFSVLLQANGLNGVCIELGTTNLLGTCSRKMDIKHLAEIN